MGPQPSEPKSQAKEFQHEDISFYESLCIAFFETLFDHISQLNCYNIGFTRILIDAHFENSNIL